MAYFFPAPFADQTVYFRRSVEGLRAGGSWAGAYLEDVLLALLAVEVAATRDQTPASELEAFRREATTALRPLVAQVSEYVAMIADEAACAGDDTWETLCGKRSAIEFLRRFYAANVDQDDVERLDHEMRRLGVAEGPVRPDFRLPGMPSSHWWWWHPRATPAQDAIEKALEMTEARLARAPEGSSVHAMLASIGNQLVFMRDTITLGRRPTMAEKNSLTLHVIAVREYEESDASYCEALSLAAHVFRSL